jgi:tripartite-type tricarboxylate transporter receptor subunit TctC
VLVTAPSSGFATVDDLKNAGRPITFGTTGVGTGSQLSQELLFAQSGIEATAVPFDGVTPIVTFAEERPSYLPDTPTAVEAGYDVPVQQSRAVFAPSGTPQEVLDRLQTAFQTAFDSPEYQQFNEDNQLTPNEVPGDELREQWTSNLDSYRSVVEEYAIDLGGSE